MKRFITLVCVVGVLLLAACGDSSQPAARNSIKAVIKTTALTADKNIAGITLTIALPTGVAPPLLSDGTADAPATVEVVSAVGSSTLPGATYIRASGSSGAQLSVSAIVAAGFSANDEITIHLTVAEGADPVATDFKLLAFEAYSGIDNQGNGGVKVYDMNVTDGSNTVTLNPSLSTTIH